MRHPSDPNAESAEFIDLLIAPFWRNVEPALFAAINDNQPTGGVVVVDVGAGSGLGTVAIGNALPDAEIFAVEPSAGLRSALFAKVNGDESLRSRVTVLPNAFSKLCSPARGAWSWP